jgi:hypothetical protein
MGRLGNVDGWTGSVATALLQTGGNKFYINNAVSAPSAIGSVNSDFFCPISSVMDNMPICSTTATARLKNGLETGIMDVRIHDPENTMTYRVRVVPNADSSWAKIAAYVKINGEVIINVGDTDTDTADWPDRANYGNVNGPNPAILVNLLGGAPNPMDAKTCLKGIFEAYNKILTNSGITSYENLLDQLSSPDQTATNPLPSQLRRVILEASFQKSLGDILQELAGVAYNGGYEYIANNPSYNPIGIIDPALVARLQLNNDRPSAVRALLLILYATQGINPQVIAGFMTEWKDKKKISISKYALAENNQTGGSGKNGKGRKGIISKKGGTKNAKKTKKKRNKKKHTKKMKFRKAHKSKKHRKTKRKGK